MLKQLAKNGAALLSLALTFGCGAAADQQGETTPEASQETTPSSAPEGEGADAQEVDPRGGTVEQGVPLSQGEQLEPSVRPSPVLSFTTPEGEQVLVAVVRVDDEASVGGWHQCEVRTGAGEAFHAVSSLSFSEGSEVRMMEGSRPDTVVIGWEADQTQWIELSWDAEAGHLTESSRGETESGDWEPPFDV